jgi:hypothetical protein
MIHLIIGIIFDFVIGFASGRRQPAGVATFFDLSDSHLTQRCTPNSSLRRVPQMGLL